MQTEKCQGCSKENISRVPIIRVVQKLDEHFARNDLAGAVALLEYWNSEAVNIGDTRGRLEILNEQIGIYRRTYERDKALAAVSDALQIIENEGLEGALSVGTIYINIATTLKAFGKVTEAMPCYEKAEAIYNNYNEVPVFQKAALNNNKASALTELGRFKDAEQCYLNAIEMLKGDSAYFGEIAVSYVNLAHLYEDMACLDTKIYAVMDKAWSYLTHPDIKSDGNYAFVCTKCAPSFEYFGFSEREQILSKEAERIYEGS
ncbi:MAG: tetratricopeptide repeat protein [Clostridia bacterium]|nr:tetratricopeptide repeat protein [Clostridia bacterium]